MSMKLWAKNEIEIAINNAKKYLADDGFGAKYEEACLKSALKAYKKLCNDNHSGCSFSVTKNILIRLMNGLPLTPITEGDKWNEVTRKAIDEADGEELVIYQSNRMSSLFKYENSVNGKDTSIKYRDNNRVVCFSLDGDGSASYYSGLVSNVIDKMFPIEMPYYPCERPYKIYCEEFLTDKKNGDFDTVGIFYGIEPNGSRLDIKRYFKYDITNSDEEWVEISYKTYKRRKEKQIPPEYLTKSSV